MTKGACEVAMRDIRSSQGKTPGVLAADHFASWINTPTLPRVRARKAVPVPVRGWICCTRVTLLGLLASILLAGVGFSGTAPQVQSEASYAAAVLTPTQVVALLDGPTGSSVVLIDVREPDENEAVRIPKSLNLPLSQVRWRIADLDRNATLVVYCFTQVRATKAWIRLRRLGFEKVIVLKGGLKAWFDIRGPVETPRVLPWQIGKGCES